MNETAKNIGAVNSNFVNPDGYYSTEQYTTANDMLAITKYAISFPQIRETSAKRSARHVFISGEDKTWYSTNNLIMPDSNYYYQYATGLKTGTNDSTNYCLVALAKRDGTEMLTVIMNAPSKDSRFRDAITLFDAAYGKR
jgi:D-alanyl-D-alanine carboxypeptidase (penicillin-binding protein 5/6)